MSRKLYGYTGKVLRVNLTDEQTITENLDTETLTKYLGGTGLGIKYLYEEELRYSYRIHTLLYHSGLLEKIIDAAYSMAQEDPKMMQAIIALFTRNQTRKHIWKTLLSQKRKLIKNLGLSTSLRLIPTLLQALKF